MKLLILLTLIFFMPQEPKMVPCTVTEVVEEGVRSDCHGWQPAKGEKMFMFGDVSKRLKVGDVFYFVWKETRWVAEIHASQSPAPEPKIVTCTVVDDQSVACPEGGKMVLFRFDDAATAKQIFDEWRLVAPLQNGSVNADAPLGTQEIKVGDKVKATIADDRFRSIAACEVRVWRNIKLWQQQGLRQGERPPAGLNTLPDDCQPGYGKN